MGFGDPVLGGDGGEQRIALLLLAAHQLGAAGPFSRGWDACSAASQGSIGRQEGFPSSIS